MHENFAWNVEVSVSKLQTHALKSTFFQLQQFFCTYGYLFKVIFAFLTFGIKGIRILAEHFLSPGIIWFTENSQWAQNSIFPNGKQTFPNSLINS